MFGKKGWNLGYYSLPVEFKMQQIRQSSVKLEENSDDLTCVFLYPKLCSVNSLSRQHQDNPTQPPPQVENVWFKLDLSPPPRMQSWQMKVDPLQSPTVLPWWWQLHASPRSKTLRLLDPSYCAMRTNSWCPESLSDSTTHCNHPGSEIFGREPCFFRIH